MIKLYKIRVNVEGFIEHVVLTEKGENPVKIAEKTFKLNDYINDIDFDLDFSSGFVEIKEIGDLPWGWEDAYPYVGQVIKSTEYMTCEKIIAFLKEEKKKSEPEADHPDQLHLDLGI